MVNNNEEMECSTLIKTLSHISDDNQKNEALRIMICRVHFIRLADIKNILKKYSDDKSKSEAVQIICSKKKIMDPFSHHLSNIVKMIKNDDYKVDVIKHIVENPITARLLIY